MLRPILIATWVAGTLDILSALIAARHWRGRVAA
jgi:hypothetical protein